VEYDAFTSCVKTADFKVAQLGPKFRIVAHYSCVSHKDSRQNRNTHTARITKFVKIVLTLAREKFSFSAELLYHLKGEHTKPPNAQEVIVVQ
jgi:hypothetical protein